MNDDETKGPFIVWQDYGYDGWAPMSFATLKEALESRKHQAFVITKVAEFSVVETESA